MARSSEEGQRGPSGELGRLVEEERRLEALVDLLLEAASGELLVRRLADGLARTTRQLNTLDQRVGPGLQDQIRATERVLEEREREEVLRIRHVLRRGGGGRPS